MIGALMIAALGVLVMCRVISAHDVCAAFLGTKSSEPPTGEVDGSKIDSPRGESGDLGVDCRELTRQCQCRSTAAMR